ncbi:sensor histidine kinase [Chondromyces apiculatus]|uniref:sensor histidine kinase n=1 Tax=Chondromyces apiculatus TaxID=51 RepID=UPI0018CC5C03|nr:HAMP domain-containing sensor histidine kinase [Chondromyces apiculatus]
MSLLSTLGHDLRTPLNSIIGYSELLQEELRDAGHEDWVDDLEQVRASGRVLLDLINRLVDLAKVEVGRIALAPVPLSFAAVTAEVAAAVAPALAARGQRLELWCPADAGSAVLDPARLAQCLSCMVQSVAELSGPGVVDLRVTPPEGSTGARFAIQMLAQPEGAAEPGSIPSVPAHPSAQSAQNAPSWSGARLHAGAQVGLLLARELCELLGGEFQVQAGATIVLRLPGSPPRALHEEGAAPGSAVIEPEPPPVVATGG